MNKVGFNVSLRRKSPHFLILQVLNWIVNRLINYKTSRQLQDGGDVLIISSDFETRLKNLSDLGSSLAYRHVFVP